MDFNFFQWLRDGVKHSVMLGVSDAIRELGAPESGAPLHEALRQTAVASNSAATPAGTPRVGAAGSRRRLGKSLKDISPPKS